MRSDFVCDSSVGTSTGSAVSSSPVSVMPLSVVRPSFTSPFAKRTPSCAANETDFGCVIARNFTRCPPAPPPDRYASCTEASIARMRTCDVAGSCTVAFIAGTRNSSTRKLPESRPSTQSSTCFVFGPASVTEYSPSFASFGTVQVDSALPPASHASGSSQRASVELCRTTARTGNADFGANANPAPVRRRQKCFMPTVSPARSSVRSKTVATESSW